jgi:hypothetical protein
VSLAGLAAEKGAFGRFFRFGDVRSDVARAPALA